MARRKLLGAQDDVDTAVGADDVAHLADLEREGRVFERLLHLALQYTMKVSLISGQARDRGRSERVTHSKSGGESS